MKDRIREEQLEIYHEASELLVQIVNLTSKWVRVRDLVNKHNYKHLDEMSEQIDTLDALWQAEKQIRKILKKYKEEI